MSGLELHEFILNNIGGVPHVLLAVCTFFYSEHSGCKGSPSSEGKTQITFLACLSKSAPRWKV
jgi:hypothetical protein